MKIKIFSSIFLAALFVSPFPAQAAPVPVYGGGIYSAGSVPSSEISDRRGESSALPSCRRVEFRGTSGTIHVDTTDEGTVRWGIYMHDPALNDGPWDISVFVGSIKVDQKKQNYAPHGSINPKKAIAGRELKFDGWHKDLKGGFHKTTANVCVIPR